LLVLCIAHLGPSMRNPSHVVQHLISNGLVLGHFAVAPYWCINYILYNEFE